MTVYSYSLFPARARARRPRCSSTASSRSSPTPPSTTPRAPPAAPTKRNSLGGKGIGSTEGSGICHSYAPDGRCISLLKILLTNFCVYDCLYCVNRVTSNVARARFTVDEVVQLTLDFYRRNCIEGLFLSSGIIRSPDYTMEQVVEVARVLREEHDFRGYIHLKTIPEASADLLARAGRYADRLSINIELPTAAVAGRAGAREGRRGDPPLDGAPAHPHRRREGGGAAGAGRVAEPTSRRSARGRRASRRPARARR